MHFYGTRALVDQPLAGGKRPVPNWTHYLFRRSLRWGLMPNKETHVSGGLLRGLAVGLATVGLVAEADRLAHVVTCTLSAVVGAALPDVMEPA